MKNKARTYIFFIYISAVFFSMFSVKGSAQDSLRFSGQLSSWMGINPDLDLPVQAGVRYIPQINYGVQLPKDRLIDFEGSAKIFGTAGIRFFDFLRTDGAIKPFRAWARYSSRQFEVRAGLQKINFGSAMVLRPLMWFDQIDPRDPLKLTDGVWGILARYYFLNNANLWLWGLYGNDKPKGWEFAGTHSHYPEIGGRVQYPVPHGEAAISYHYRVVDTRKLGEDIPAFAKIPENRIGFDAKFDVLFGFWLEGSWVHKNADLGKYSNQEFLNAGLDYTFGIGNGLYMVAEQLVASNDEKAFSFSNTFSATALSLSYPVGLFDNISAIVYFDWANGDIYNFVNWQKQFDRITIYFMGFWNPDIYILPGQEESENLFAGKGVQIMLVFNH